MTFIKDKDCTVDTPVAYGKEERGVYGRNVRFRPRVPGKRKTSTDKKNYLKRLLPLEDYDLIIVLFSGGKDSLAAYLKLLEWGVPKEKIELWHHDIDGGHPDRKMDWPVTQSYVEAFAKAEGVRLRKSWRVNGFWGEVYRVGASWPVQYDGDDGNVVEIPLTKKQKRSNELRETLLEEPDQDALKELEGYGYRKKFPAKSGNLATRWCSAYLKIMVAESVVRNLEKLSELELFGKRLKFPAKGSPQSGRWCSGALKMQVQGSVTADLKKTRDKAKILVVSGERRGESSGRANYNEMELHRTFAYKKLKRVVHQWRPVIDHSEKDIWEIIKRHRVTPHPCYSAGWNRCSCMMCIFSLPKHWAGIRQLFPEEVEAVKRDEEILGFTLDNKKDLETYIGDAESCLYPDKEAIQQIITGNFPEEKVYTDDWKYPAGAFKGSDGGPC